MATYGITTFKHISIYLKAFKYLFKWGKYDKNNHKLDIFYAFFVYYELVGLRK